MLLFRMKGIRVVIERYDLDKMPILGLYMDVEMFYFIIKGYIHVLSVLCEM